MDTCIHVTMSLRTGLRETYETNGGSKVLPQYFAEGEVDIAPDIPTKTGYTFDGWYTDAECSMENKWEFGIPLTVPRCLYAAQFAYAFCGVEEKTGYSLSCQTNLPEEWTKEKGA